MSGASAGHALGTGSSKKARAMSTTRSSEIVRDHGARNYCETMEALDEYFRYASSTLMLVLAGLLLRDQRNLLAVRLFVVFAINQALEGFSGTVLWHAVPDPIRDIEDLVTRQFPILLWWFTLALFEDDFRPRRLEWSLGAVWLGLSVYDHFVPDAPGLLRSGDDLALRLMAAGIAGLVAWRLFVGLRGDLIEERRRLRFFFGAGILAIFLSDVVTDLTVGDQWGPAGYNAFVDGVILALTVAGFFWVLRVDRSVLAFSPPVIEIPPLKPDFTAAEAALKQKLDTTMAEGAFLDPDLSIGALASRLDAPEHQVRALINRALGHRNFRAFLNEHRLDAAKSALADREKARVPILTIAMDSGFASLAPFNRAFKKSTGQTPSEWRAKALDGADQN